MGYEFDSKVIQSTTQSSGPAEWGAPPVLEEKIMKNSFKFSLNLTLILSCTPILALHARPDHTQHPNLIQIEILSMTFKAIVQTIGI